MSYFKRGAVGFGGLVLAGALLSAADWPQYRGGRHDGISDDRIRTNWTSEPPAVRWRAPLTDGFSSFAVSGGMAVTQVRRLADGRKQETCLALDAATGRELWDTPLGYVSYWAGGGTGDGPRSTPTIAGDRVYVSNSLLVLFCLRASDGHVLWSRDLPALYGGEVIGWQNAASPLLDEGRIFLSGTAPNGCLLALNADDGTLLWKRHNDAMTHATPVAADILGVRQIVFLAQSGLVSVLPGTGDVLWRFAFPYDTCTGASPVVAGDIVYCSAAYGIGGAAARVVRTDSLWKAQRLWGVERDINNHWNTPVHINGYFYTMCGHYQNPILLRCVEAATGRVAWSQGGFGMGNLLAAGGRLLVLSDSGTLVLIDPDPAAYREIDRMKILSGKCWNSPAIADGRIYARSVTEGACVDVAAPAAPRLRLLPSTPAGEVPFRLSIQCQDGSPVAPDRLPGIAVYASPDPAAPLAEWTRLALSPILVEGQAGIEDPEGCSLPQRFYRLEEP